MPSRSVIVLRPIVITGVISVVKHIIITGGQKEKIGPRKWRIRVSLGKDPQTGKYRRSKSRIVIGNSKDADAALAAYRAELQAALDSPDSGITFREYAEGLHEAREALGGESLVAQARTQRD